MRDQNQFLGLCRGGDQQIKVVNRDSFSFQMDAQFRILLDRPGHGQDMKAFQDKTNLRKLLGTASLEGSDIEFRQGNLRHKTIMEFRTEDILLYATVAFKHVY